MTLGKSHFNYWVYKKAAQVSDLELQISVHQLRYL